MDTSVVRTAKRVLPGPVKSAAASGLRAYGMLTSPLRGVPDYLLIGAKRCGSTSLHTYLCQHPDVLPLFPAAARRKGTHYFDRDPHRSLAWYRSHFRIVPPRSVRRARGEASTYYFLHPRAADRAAALAPAAKVIVLLREPAERAFSHYRDEVKNGHEHLSFSDAVAAEESRVAPELVRMAVDPHYYSFSHEHFSYVSWGHYAEHLRRWLAACGRKQVLVLRSEDLFNRPQEVYGQVTDFLGLVPFHPGHFDRYNAAPRGERDEEVIRRLREHYASHNAELRQLLPSLPAWP
jgi:hypothetical protein